MPPERTFHYEAMFLVGQSSAADLGAVITHIDELLGRCEAKLVSMAKWDERRLAFEIEKQKRGLYILTYFEAPAQKISQLDRDCQMSETIMRLLVTRADHLTMEEMQAADGREALMSEAKLRAEKASEDQEQAEDTSVRMGRPVEEAAPEKAGEQPAEGSGDGANSDAEPTVEGEAAEPAANA
ncbi:MAG: 30S ribosomal protein S6 [Planctomycetota bacterium]